MCSGTFQDSINTFVMAPGSFPSWWPERTPAPCICKKTSTLYSGCGCTQNSTNIHSTTCIHPKATTIGNRGRAVGRTKRCKTLEKTRAFSDVSCSVCKIDALLRTESPDRNLLWISLSATEKMYVKKLYLRKIALQDATFAEAARQRQASIKAAWETHTTSLFKRGILELQPNVQAVEDGFVYTLRVCRELDGEILTMTRIESVEEWEAVERDSNIPRKMFATCSLNRPAPKPAPVSVAVKVSTSLHDKAKCMMTVALHSSAMVSLGA
ncbi:hypothetical protein BKA65DRAFT_477687 [Rhexocercosporidium sp. MPI-PUGE-AT-0058]|nr:hypothetical protein BKA65DRAFT_477687 [Rhexocercosporidium sp. MPI-PUGE-AT-0058]